MKMHDKIFMLIFFVFLVVIAKEKANLIFVFHIRSDQKATTCNPLIELHFMN